MLKVGITGGIGCGKSTVAQVFASYGIPCFICDSVAAAYYSDAAFCQQMVSLLGGSVVKSDGTISKRAVADIIFADEDKMKAVNELIHPKVMRDFERWCQQWVQSPYVLFESAILYEYGLDSQMDAVVAVHAGIGERVERLRLRDKATVAQIEAIINAQMASEEKMQRADYVILNYEGNPRERQVEHVHHLLLHRATGLTP